MNHPIHDVAPDDLSKRSFLLDDTRDKPHGPRFVRTHTTVIPVLISLPNGDKKIIYTGEYATRWVDLGSMWTEMQWENRLLDDPWVLLVGIRPDLPELQLESWMRV